MNYFPPWTLNSTGRVFLLKPFRSVCTLGELSGAFPQKATGCGYVTVSVSNMSRSMALQGFVLGFPSLSGTKSACLARRRELARVKWVGRGNDPRKLSGDSITGEADRSGSFPEEEEANVNIYRTAAVFAAELLDEVVPMGPWNNTGQPDAASIVVGHADGEDEEEDDVDDLDEDDDEEEEDQDEPEDDGLDYDWKEVGGEDEDDEDEADEEDDEEQDDENDE